MREALLDLKNEAKDPTIRTEAKPLVEEVRSFHFLVPTVVSKDMLSQILQLSKPTQFLARGCNRRSTEND